MTEITRYLERLLFILLGFISHLGSNSNTSSLIVAGRFEEFITYNIYNVL